jgi:hypothetical protein
LEIADVVVVGVEKEMVVAVHDHHDDDYDDDVDELVLEQLNS